MGTASNTETSYKSRPFQQKLRLSFELLSGPMDGLEFQFDKEEVTIGRADSNDLCLDLDVLVSRHHAIITAREGIIQVEDTKSTNGTYLEEKRLHEKAILKSGDIFRVGLTELQVKF